MFFLFFLLSFFIVRFFGIRQRYQCSEGTIKTTGVVPCQVTRPLRHISLPEAMSSGNLLRENRVVALFFGSIWHHNQEDTLGNKMVVSSFCLLRIRTMPLQPCQVTPDVLHPSFPVTWSLSSLEGEDVSPNSSSVVVRCSVRASFSHIQEAT
jgi:hypothetical protein